MSAPSGESTAVPEYSSATEEPSLFDEYFRILDGLAYANDRYFKVPTILKNFDPKAMAERGDILQTSIQLFDIDSFGVHQKLNIRASKDGYPEGLSSLDVIHQTLQLLSPEGVHAQVLIHTYSNGQEVLREVEEQTKNGPVLRIHAEEPLDLILSGLNKPFLNMMRHQLDISVDVFGPHFHGQRKNTSQGHDPWDDIYDWDWEGFHQFPSQRSVLQLKTPSRLGQKTAICTIQLCRYKDFSCPICKFQAYMNRELSSVKGLLLILY
jgi:hypothetical protein